MYLLSKIQVSTEVRDWYTYMHVIPSSLLSQQPGHFNTNHASKRALLLLEGFDCVYHSNRPKSQPPGLARWRLTTPRRSALDRERRNFLESSEPPSDSATPTPLPRSSLKRRAASSPSNSPAMAQAAFLASFYAITVGQQVSDAQTSSLLPLFISGTTRSRRRRVRRIPFLLTS